MRKPEQQVYDRMKKNRPYTLWLQRVENLVSEGMPDVHYASPVNSGWVELKAAKKPKRVTSKLLGSKGLRQSQINWFLKAQTKCLVTFILIQDSEGELYLIHGQEAATVNDCSVERLRELRLASDWDNIFKIIMEWEK